MKQVTENVFAETGFRGCNPGFVVTSEGVVMIDTPQLPTDAMAWQAEINRHGQVRYLINTEPHGDHYSGNYFFKGTIIAHEGTRQVISRASVEQFKERLNQISPKSLALMDGYGYRLPTITFTKKLTLFLGDHTFQLINFPGHTPYQVAVYIPEERVMFTSDNIFYRVQAWLHQALPYEWLISLDKMQDLDADILIPGHGDICDRSYIPEMKTFIQTWIDVVSAAIKQGLNLEEAQDKISLLNRYPMEKGSEAMAQYVQRMNVTHLYEVLKNEV